MPLFEVANFALGQQPPAAEHDDVVAHGLHVRQQVAGKDQAQALVAGQVARQLQQFFAAGRVHAVGRLVQDEQLGVVDDCRRQLEPLFHAGRIRLDLAVAGLAQSDIVQHLVGALERVLGGHADQFAGVGHELGADGAREQALVFGREADLAADVELLAAEVLVEDLARTVIDGNQAEHGADEGGLAGAVRSQEADGACGDGHREVIEGRDGAVGFCDTLKLEQHANSRRGSWAALIVGRAGNRLFVAAAEIFS